MNRLYFPTNRGSAQVVNARTGQAYLFIAASRESKSLFHVIDNVLPVDEEGYSLTEGTRRGVYRNHLFYDTPSEYEDHLGAHVPPYWKERWRRDLRLCSEMRKVESSDPWLERSARKLKEQIRRKGTAP